MAEVIPIAAAAAGALAAAAYADARWSLRKDMATIARNKKVERIASRAAKSKRTSVWYGFEENVNRLPESTQCIWSREASYTWKETHQRSSQYSNFFLANGVKPGTVVAMYQLNSPEFVFTCLGLWAAGCGSGWINHNLSGDGLVHCLKVSTAKILLVDAESGCRARIGEVRGTLEKLGMRIIILDAHSRREMDGMPVKPPEESYRQDIRPEDPLMLMYTSGSTGMPKACPIRNATARSFAGRALQLGLTPGPDGDRWYNCMPLYHGTGGTTMISCLLSGITQCIGRKFSVSRFWDDVRESDSTGFVYVGETARYLLAAPPSPRDREHRAWFMFGNGMRPDVWERFVERFGITQVAEFFTSTEGVFALFNCVQGPWLQNSVGHQGAILRWMTNGIYVPVAVDHEDEDIVRDPKTGFAKRTSYEEGGEILVKIPSEAAFGGYYGNEDATQKKYMRDVFQKGDLYYRTGDALRRTSDGRWFFQDRLGDTYRWKSENVSTVEVAEKLGRAPGVLETMVYGVAVPGHDGKAGCCAINIDPSISEDAYPRFFEELLRFARGCMPRYAVPIFVRVLRQTAATHNNKQNKAPLKKAGIDLDRIYGEGVDVEQAWAEGKDVMMWCPWALGLGKKGARESYVTFDRPAWDMLRGGGSPASVVRL